MSWENPYKESLESFPGVLFDEQRSENSLQQHIQQLTSPLFLEIGSGSGSHVITLSQRSPSFHCIGIEKRYKRAVRTAEKAEKLGVNNLTVVRGDFYRVVRLLPKSSVCGVFCNFPDPWDKNRWKKHRMLSDVGLSILESVLVPGGFLSFKTDHNDLFTETAEHIQQREQWSIRYQSKSLLQETPALFNNIESEFEGLFRSKQQPIAFMHCVFSSSEEEHCHPYFGSTPK